MQREGHVIEAIVRFADGADTRAPGGAVTAALCGHWEHEGPCRWPHHTAVDGDRVRTVFAVSPEEAPTVGAEIERALRDGAADWTVVSCSPSELTDFERVLASRLARTPLP